jgi:hypothetical protein
MDRRDNRYERKDDRRDFSSRDSRDQRRDERRDDDRRDDKRDDRREDKREFVSSRDYGRDRDDRRDDRSGREAKDAREEPSRGRLVREEPRREQQSVRTIVPRIDVDAIRPKTIGAEGDWKAEREILQNSEKERIAKTDVARDFGRRDDQRRFPKVDVGQLRPRVDFKNRGDPGRPTIESRLTDGGTRQGALGRQGFGQRRIPVNTPKIDRKKVICFPFSLVVVVVRIDFLFVYLFAFVLLLLHSSDSIDMPVLDESVPFARWSQSV